MKKTMKLFILTFCVLMFTWFLSCKNTEVSMYSGVNPTFQSFDVPEVVYEFNAETSSEFSSSTGSKISIPEGAFVNHNGEPVKGKVKLTFREFHTPAEILTSGIPMTYKSQDNSSENTLQSAGMFEIRAEQKGEELEVATGKSIKVDLASFQSGSDYNFYALNDESGSWKELGLIEPILNQSKMDELVELKELERTSMPIIPEKHDKNKPVINLLVDYQRFPELKNFEGLLWQSVNPTDTVLFSQSWQRYDMERSAGDNTFEFSFSNESRTVKSLLKPVLSGKNYKKAQAEFEKGLTCYNASMQTIKEKRNMLNRQADILRSFSVNNMGIYNWDRIYKLDESVKTVAEFKVEGEQPESPDLLIVFLITPEDNAVVKYDYNSWDRFNFDPGKLNKIVAILPGDRVAFFSSDSFNSLERNKIENRNCTFNLSLSEARFSGMDDLNNLINSI